MIGIAVFVLVFIYFYTSTDNEKKSGESSLLDVRTNVKESASIKGSMRLEVDEVKYKKGDEINVYIKIDTNGYNINTSKSIIGYSSDVLKVQSIDTSKSVLSKKVKENINDDIITIIRGDIGDADFKDNDDGYNGNGGLVAVIKFKAVKTGIAQLFLYDGSRIVLDDGKGTPMDTSLNIINLSIE